MNTLLKGILLCLPIMCLAHVECTAQEGSITNSDPSLRQSTEGQYSYKAEGRSDPFRPFISSKTASPDPNEIVEDKIQYSGMQLFEPGQLNLVGIMATPHGAVALVEDQTKKGYMLRAGDLIGKRGVVTSIDEHQVIVTETARTRSGKEIKNLVTMKLKREGDK